MKKRHRSSSRTSHPASRTHITARTDVRYSVIIPTHNRVHMLQACLSAVFDQTLSSAQYEVIVVNDGSTDGTADFLASYAPPSGGQLRVVHSSHGGCASARNLGVEHARGSILFFTDDDCVVPRVWMETLLRGFDAHPDVVGVGGWYRPSDDMLKRNRFARINDAIERMYYGYYETHEVYANIGVNPCGNTANVAYRRSLFQDIGGFDTYTKKTAMIDYEFVLRIASRGYFTLYIPLVILHNKHLTFLEYAKKCVRYGMADEYLSRKYAGRHQVRQLINIFWFLAEVKKWSPQVSSVWVLFFLGLRIWGSSRARVAPISVRAVPMEVARRKHVDTYLDGVVQETEYIAPEEYTEDRTMMTHRLDAYQMLEGEYETPLVSVVIPFYNRPEYVTEEFIASLNKLSVSDSAIELIFVDDGSTDHTREVLLQAVPRFRFTTRVLSRPNGGPSAARNTGIRDARGAYIAFTDSDVLVPSLWLHSLLFPFLLSPRVVVSGGSQIDVAPMTYFDEWRNSTILPSPLCLTNQFNARPYDSAHLMVCRERLSDSSLLYFDESFRLPGGEDMDYTMRMKRAGGMAAFVPTPIHNKRSMHLNDFLKLCIARSIGINKVKEKHRDLAPYIPGYFTALHLSATVHMFVHLLRRPKVRTGLLMHIFLRAIDSTPQGKFYALLSSLAEHQITRRLS